MEQKTFKGDFDKFYQKFKNKENFSFCKFSDGELYILKNQLLVLGPNPEHHSYQDDSDHKLFDPEKHQFYRERLFDSLKYKSENYYIGICAPSDYGDQDFYYLKNESRQDEEHLTWANLFVNSNYKLFCDLIIPEFSNFEIIIVCNKKSTFDKAPFADKIIKDFRVGTNCIINDYHMVDLLKAYVLKNKIQNKLFLFCCSSLGNFMCQQLNEIEPNNIYFDCGSTLNPYLGLSTDRGYLQAALGNLWRGQDTSADLSREETWKI